MTIAKMRSKGQVTIPKKVREKLGVHPGESLELLEGPDGFLLRHRRIDNSRLAPLRGKFNYGQGNFNLKTFRNEPYDQTI
jgi:AbrB family looped-hinge helix DNA binding protein